MKYISTIILTALVVGFGVTAYFKGWLPTVTFYKPQAVSVQNTEISDVVKPTNIPAPFASSSAVASPSASPATIKAGGVLAFKAYSIEVPSGWVYSREANPTGEVASDKLTLTKDGYKILISQAAAGGAQCLFTGDAEMEGPSSKYSDYKEIITKSSEKLRRSWTTDAKAFSVCEKIGTNPYGIPTTFGYIAITVPAGGSTTLMITEIDSILASLKKI